MAEHNGHNGATHNDTGNGFSNGHAGNFDTDPEETERLRKEYEQSKNNPWGNEAPLVCEPLAPLPMTAIPPRTWAYGSFLLFGHAQVIGAVDGGGKGAHAVVIALAMITGRALLGEHVWRTGPVAIITYEDDEMEWRRRIASACVQYSTDYDQVCGSFYFIRRPRGRIKLAAQSALGRPTVVFPDGDAIIAALKKIGAVLLIVDPFNHAHTLEDGNSNAIVAQLAAEIARIAAESMVAALVLHHLRKGSNGHADDLMGAVMLRATFRAARILVRMSTAEAEQLSIPAKEAWRYSRIAGSKENYAPPPDRATWYKFESHNLGNGAGIYPDGDNVHVVTRWQPPDPFEDTQRSQLAEVFTTFRNGLGDGEFYTFHAGSKNRWAGNVVMTVMGKTEGEAGRMLAAWKKSGALTEDIYRSPNNHDHAKRIVLDETKAREILGALYQSPEAAV
jgi:hypothetical protein